MGPSAEFDAEVRDLHHPNLLPILLSKEGHGSRLEGLLHPHDLRLKLQILPDLLIDEGLNPFQFLLVIGAKWVKSNLNRSGATREPA